MDESPINNPFDEDDKKGGYQTSHSADMSPIDADTGSRSLAWLIVGVAAIGCGLLAAVALIYFRPDLQAMYNETFPSPTATVTRTPTSTPTPNLTATRQVINITSTAQAVETLVADAGSEWKVLIDDSFDNVGDHWITGTDDDEYATIIRRGVDRAYQWDATAKQGFISWIAANEEPLTDFYVSVEAERVSGSTSSDYGLVFREDEDGNFYYIGIGDEGYFISIYYQDEWIDVVDYTISSVIAAGEKNRITVIASGSHFVFLINNIVVAEAMDERIPAGTTALAMQLYDAGLEATIAFDNFELRAPR